MTELSFTKSYLSTLDSRPIKLQSDYAADPRTLEITAPYTLPRMPSPMRKKDGTVSESVPTVPGSAPAVGIAAGEFPTTATQGAVASNPTLTVSLKSTLRSSSTQSSSSSSAAIVPSFTQLSVPNVNPAITSVFDLKQRIASSLTGQTSQQALDISKIKILYERKPVSDAKTVKDVLSGEAGLSSFLAKSPAPQDATVEFGVMIMGGYSTTAPSSIPSSISAASDHMDIGPVAASAPAPAAVNSQISGAPNQSGRSTLSDAVFWKDLQGFLEQRIRDEDVAGEAVGLFRRAWEQAQS